MIRVLIVDENQIFREVFGGELLNHFPFVSIQEAKDGREAMEKIQRIRPALIFMDICLPGLDGLQLTQKIKEEFPEIRIAILTNYDFPQYRHMASQYGVDRYFVKDSLDWKEVEDLMQNMSTEG